jgi:hypothetical protein
LAGTGASVDSEATSHFRPRQQVADQEKIRKRDRSLRRDVDHWDLAGVIKTLQVRWGYCMTEKLELARDMIREAAMWCPGLTNYLNAIGLGSDPWLIQKLAERRRR